MHTYTDLLEMVGLVAMLGIIVAVIILVIYADINARKRRELEEMRDYYSSREPYYD